MSSRGNGMFDNIKEVESMYNTNEFTSDNIVYRNRDRDMSKVDSELVRLSQECMEIPENLIDRAKVLNEKRRYRIYNVQVFQDA